MKEANFGHLAYNLLNAATALAGILDQRIEGGFVEVSFQYASELIHDLQVSAKSAADELMWLHFEKEVEL